MTMPHLMNCPHSDEWCLDCVKALHDEKEAETERLHEVYEEATNELIDIMKPLAEACGKPITKHNYPVLTGACAVEDLPRDVVAVALNEIERLRIASGNYHGKCGACGTACMDMLTDDYCADCEISRLKELLREVSTSGIEYSAGSYLTIQISTALWDDIRKAVADDNSTNHQKN